MYDSLIHSRGTARSRHLPTELSCTPRHDDPTTGDPTFGGAKEGESGGII